MKEIHIRLHLSDEAIGVPFFYLFDEPVQNTDKGVWLFENQVGLSGALGFFFLLFIAFFLLLSFFKLVRVRLYELIVLGFQVLLFRILNFFGLAELLFTWFTFFAIFFFRLFFLFCCPLKFTGVIFFKRLCENLLFLVHIILPNCNPVADSGLDHFDLEEKVPLVFKPK